MSISFDKTYKVTKYKYENNGKISKVNFDFQKPIVNFLSGEEISKLSLTNLEIKTNLSSKKNNTIISGKYTINKENPLTFVLKNHINKNLMNLNLDLEYSKNINLALINYQKPKDSIANLYVNLEKKKNNIRIKKISLIEKKNSIVIEDLKLKNNNLLSFKKISVKTNKSGKINNNFSILFGKKIIIKGSQFDASNLPKILNEKNNRNNIKQISKDIEINFTNIIAPLSENLKNFKLIGKIEKGKFIKISSKGDFGENNFLDISMKNDEKNKKNI